MHSRKKTTGLPKSSRSVSSAAGPHSRAAFAGPIRSAFSAERMGGREWAEAPTPRSLGYRMPAEWEPHAATWLAWPHNRSDWPGKFSAIPWVFADIVRHLARVEDVNLIVASAREKQTAREILKRSHVKTSRVKFY